MYPVGVNRKRNVDAIIDEQSGIVASCQVAQLGCKSIQLPAFKVLLAQLDGSDATI
jgi:hypothetical protein